MIFEKPTFRRVRRYLGIFKPKSGFQVLLVVVYAFWFLVTVLPHLKDNTGRSVLIFAAAIFVGGAVLLPESALRRWEGLWRWVRSGVFAVLAYVVTVTLGWLPEFRSLSSWGHVLLLSGGAPFSNVHALAIFGMLPAWLSQGYSPSTPRGFPEQFIRGTPEVLAWEEAVAFMENIGNTCGWGGDFQQNPEGQLAPGNPPQIGNQNPGPPAEHERNRPG